MAPTSSRSCASVSRSAAATARTSGHCRSRHVFGHVSYLRRTEDVLQVTALHLYLGERWAYPDATPDRADVRARTDQLYERMRERCQALGYMLVDGSAYQEPGIQP